MTALALWGPCPRPNLITLLLCTEGILREPLLYLSLYLKEQRQRYYELLDVVRRDGDWERWLAFFAEAVAHTRQVLSEPPGDSPSSSARIVRSSLD